MSFAKIAKELRDYSGLSQQKLGEKLGLSSSGIAHLELGQREPGSNTILSYAKFFNVSADYLLGLSDDYSILTPAPMGATSPHSEELTEKEKALLEAFRKLLPETQDFILRSTQSLNDSTKKVKKF